MKSKRPVSHKKPYQPPKLTRYGTLREVTKGGGPAQKGGSKGDGGQNPPTKL